MHRRGENGPDILVLELKKTSNPALRDCDRIRVHAFRAQLEYEFGVLIECETRDGWAPAVRISDWIADAPERADGARCASLQFRRVSRHFVGQPQVEVMRSRVAAFTGTLVADRDIFINIFMPTTVHIPDPLLKSVDRRAKALGISRNRLVVRALEQAVSVRSGWPPEFLQRLRHVDRETIAAVDELLLAVKRARRSKEPRDL